MISPSRTLDDERNIILFKIMQKKIKEWVKRYALAEGIAFLVIIATTHFIKWTTGSIILAAFISPWAENVAYYGTIVITDIKKLKRKYKLSGKRFVLEV